MIPIKIQCGCGQKYAFETEPLNGHMPNPVSCPACGTDGTAAANALIAQTLSAQPAVAAAAAPGLAPLRVHLAPATPAPTASAPPRLAPRLLGQLEPEQAKHEARAKIMWGDQPRDVAKFLVMHGFAPQEASEMVQGMFQERLATLRGDGIKKVILGCACIAVPIVAFFIFMSFGVIPVKLFAITVMVGLWGCWQVFNGIFMLVAPKIATGDVAEQ